MSFDTEAGLEVFFFSGECREKKSATLSLDFRKLWLHTTHICHFCVLFRIKLRPSCGFRQETVTWDIAIEYVKVKGTRAVWRTDVVESSHRFAPCVVPKVSEVRDQMEELRKNRQSQYNLSAAG